MSNPVAICPRCQAKNHALANYCAFCGKKLPMPFISAGHHKLIFFSLLGVALIGFAQIALMIIFYFRNLS
jgi:predicted amidophosphoribosyltransferase